MTSTYFPPDRNTYSFCNYSVLQTDHASSAICFRNLDCFIISTKQIEKLLPNSLSYFFSQLCCGWTKSSLIPMWKGRGATDGELCPSPYLYNSLFLCVLTQHPDGLWLLTVTLTTSHALLPFMFSASHLLLSYIKCKAIQQ